MTDHSTPQRRFAELFQHYLDRNISDSDAEELLELWQEYPELERSALADHKVAYVLGFFSKNRDRAVFFRAKTSPDTPSLDLDELVRLASQTPSLPKRNSVDAELSFSKKSLPEKGLKPEKSPWIRWLVVPCIVLFAVVTYMEFYPGPNREQDGFVAMAQVAECIEAVWEEGTEPYKTGRELDTSVLNLKSGVVKLRFLDGAEVVLEGPCEFLVKGTDTAFCRKGRLSVFVPPRAAGFEITTPLAKIADLGTAFSTQVSETKTDVHVLKGMVEFKQAKTKKSLITEKNALLFDLNEGLRESLADPSTFIDEMKLLRLKSEYVDRRRPIWDELSTRQANDPSLLYRLVTERVVDLPRMDGSREGKTAIRFQNIRDRLSVVSPDPRAERFDSLTLIASVRIDNMRNNANTLVMGDAFDSVPGEIQWQFSRFGSLQFHVRYGEDDVRLFDSPPILKRKDYNTWCVLALVADAKNKTITHYLDGKPVSTIPWSDSIPLRFVRATIGNESLDVKKPTVRSFRGSIESITAFSRAFSPREIEVFYFDNQ